MISENKLAGVLSTVRNRVLNFVLEIVAENPAAGEAPIGSTPIKPARTEQIFYNTINVHGNVANLAGGNVESQTSVSMVRPGDWASLKSFLESAGLPAADIAELKTAVGAEPGARSIEAGSYFQLVGEGEREGNERHDNTPHGRGYGVIEARDRQFFPAALNVAAIT